ncbi:MAG: BON domain-containing protein [bacterium]
MIRNGLGCIGAGMALILWLLMTGCSSETINSAKGDIQRNTADAREKLAEVQRKAQPIIDAAKPVTDAATNEAKKRLGQLSIGARVTAALKANQQLPSTIRVDADPDGKGIKLRGEVNSHEHKALAERIARDTLGPDFRVQNDLSTAY